MAKLLEVVPADENDPITIQYKRNKKKKGHHHRHVKLPPAVTKTDRGRSTGVRASWGKAICGENSGPLNRSGSLR